ncbi:MAG TPA: hypothetical protein VGZ71_06485 [Puia sp.]|jgi:hypothetical protein|nr:hypothetical protein [Puia sp.]
MLDPIDNIRTIDLGDEKIVLDPKKFQFNDASLNHFIEQTSIWYDYYSSKSAKAEELLLAAETQYDKLYLNKFMEGKQIGSSDKGADAFARTDLSVENALFEVNKYKSAVKYMKEYLKSFDKAHSMARSRGFMIQKEIEKLHKDIYHNRGDCNVDDIISAARPLKDEVCETCQQVISQGKC